MNRRQFALAASALATAPLAALAEPYDPILTAVDGPQRSAKNRARDAYRHPAQSLAFWGLQPGITVVEVDPSGGYWTEIIAPYLKTTGGHYIAAFSGDPAPFLARYADTSIYGLIRIADFSPTTGPLAGAATVDMPLRTPPDSRRGAAPRCSSGVGLRSGRRPAWRTPPSWSPR